MEEVSPVIGISHVIYVINHHRIPFQVYHVLFSEESACNETTNHDLK